MFTGLVDAVGTITRVSETAAGRELRVTCPYGDLQDGESIAINGACLTVRDHQVAGRDGSSFSVAAVVTTLDRTTISEWTAGRRVNLERAMKLGDRLGGHLVLGHVDAVAAVRHVETRDDALLIDLDMPGALLPLLVNHGSVTVDGVSLTVNALLDNGGVQLSIIDYTRCHTTLGDLAIGDRVQVEADVLAKHVERLLAPEFARTALRQRAEPEQAVVS